MRERESFVQSAFLLTVVGVFTQVVGFFYRMLLSRTIGAEYMGLYQLVLPVYGVLQSVAVSGLSVAVCNRTAAEAARQNRRGRPGCWIRRCGCSLPCGRCCRRRWCCWPGHWPRRCWGTGGRP
ncbi:MAG: oligosaccharide flippase family protein [Clostridiales bacterium]|nr:oligosaccharide flippase family protein [Clostridiales bacterium]